MIASLRPLALLPFGPRWPAFLPRSFGWFVLTGVIFLLQLIPYTGVFLMIVAAPLWSIATVNLGFASLAFEAMVGRIHPAWLLAPLAWFGGYMGAAHLSETRLRDLDAQVRAANAGRTLAFDARRQALVFAGRSDTLASAGAQFVADYDIPVAYDPWAANKGPTLRAHRLIGTAQCEEIRKERAYGAAGIHAVAIFPAGSTPGRRGTIPGLCRVSAPEMPTLPAVTVSAKTERGGDALLHHQLDRITIADAKGPVIELLAGHAAALARWPMPVIGCSLISSAPKWQCSAGFWRAKSQGLGGDGAYGGATRQVVAQALGLVSAPAAARAAAFVTVRAPSLEGIVERHREAASAVLARVLADPTMRITVHDVAGFRETPALFAGRERDMVAAAGRALDNGPRTYETARVLQGLIVAAPRDTIGALAPDLIALFAGRTALSDDMAHDTLLAQIGEFGAPAAEVLTRFAFANPKRPDAAALFGLCRTGAAAAPLTDRLAEIIRTRPRPRSEVYEAAYVTLLRLGRPDLAEADPEPQTRPRGKVLATWLQTITPASPSSVCVSANGWPRLPGERAR